VEKKRGSIFVISGPSGSGKTTLAERLLKDKKTGKRLTKSISLTTRPKRTGEVNGRDYFFISDRQFKKYLRAKKILEWTKYLKFYYATPKDFLEKQLTQGKRVLLCLDIKGALKIKRMYPAEAVTIFILPPSLPELQKRIRQRCAKTKQEEINKRIRLASKEITASDKFDYQLLNKDLPQVLKELSIIILNKITLKQQKEGSHGLCAVRKSSG